MDDTIAGLQLLLTELHDAPQNDTLLLAYADRLDEAGDHTLAMRIRDHVHQFARWAPGALTAEERIRFRQHLEFRTQSRWHLLEALRISLAFARRDGLPRRQAG